MFLQVSQRCFQFGYVWSFLSVLKAFLDMYSVLFIHCIHILSELEIYYQVKKLKAFST